MNINKGELKAFNKIKLRKISVLNTNFLWKRGHLHLEKFNYSKCVEKVIIYLEGYKNSPLILFFREEDNKLLSTEKGTEEWKMGYPNQGVIWKSITGKTAIYGENDEAIQINLNSPISIERIINYYFQDQWKPKESSKSSLCVKNALIIINELVANDNKIA